MSGFIEYLAEVFEPFGPVQTRKMFGGYGVYHNGLMFGLVADDTLYLKADKTSVDYFTVKELTPFEYDKRGKIIQMSYYLAPEEIFDDSDAAALWAQRAYDAAVRSKEKGKK